jgi:hypothetical protein
VAIIADIFMGAIEKITSTTRKVFINHRASLVLILTIIPLELTGSRRVLIQWAHTFHSSPKNKRSIKHVLSGVFVERWVARTRSHWSADLEWHGSQFDANGSRLIGTWNLTLNYR